MNILFMSLGEFKNISAGSVHIDVIRELSKRNNVYVVCKSEKRDKTDTTLTFESGIHFLRVKTGNVKRVNLIKKGFTTVRIESQFKNAIKKHLGDVVFDAVVYTTPPITFANVVKYIKKRDNAVTYLLLKDIFPQNAVDLGMFKKNGLVYKYFRKKEKKLYELSDGIGCMSPANVTYLIDHNPYIKKDIVDIFPNCIDIVDTLINDEEKKIIKEKYNIPLDKTIFLYGGNLGKPQGIEFIKQALLSVKNNQEAFFLIIGAGTEFNSIKNFLMTQDVKNALLISSLPKRDYEKVVSACDVGLIFLDYRFTIPNFPSRLLSYMQSKIPVLAATDRNTDVGQVIENNGFGWWVQSNNPKEFKQKVKEITECDTQKMGEIGYNYLVHNYDVVSWVKELEYRLKNLKER